MNSTGHLVLTDNTPGAGATSQIILTAGTHSALGALGLTAATYNGTASATGFDITASNDKISLSVDGGAAQAITLTTGANQTATNVEADLNTYFTANSIGATASVNNGALQVTSNSTGAGSSIVFNTTANSAYATLGLTAGTTYSGSAAQTGFGVSGASFTGNGATAAPAGFAFDRRGRRQRDRGAELHADPLRLGSADHHGHRSRLDRNPAIAFGHAQQQRDQPRRQFHRSDFERHQHSGPGRRPTIQRSSRSPRSRMIPRAPRRSAS